ncbi:hypothetical protein [Streptomyces griseoluteus]|uniref:hypothetical protein n=1 Tax=Streptomyces griseoluteus TaxID=29306 RepID=UPI003444332A
MHHRTIDADSDEPSEPSRFERLMTRARRTLVLMRRRFLLGLAYGSGTGCVTLAVLFVEHHMR